MFDFLTDFFSALTWRSVLVGSGIFIVTLLASLAVVTIVLVKIEPDHFKKGHQTKFWSGPRPALRAAGIIGKNILGILLVVLGIILSIPGVPGQGLLTVLLGIMLLDFPGKSRLEQKLLSRPSIVKTINRVRERFKKPPLELD
jgi:hypothetical protein